ncbi:MAG: AMP-binding protein [Leptospirales bacterium]
MAFFPLLRPREPNAVVAYRDSQAVRVEEFLADVRALSEQLPERSHVLNLCVDRYRFSVGLAAALQRQQISLLPPSHTPVFLQRLHQDYPELYTLTDSDDMPSPIETFHFPDLSTGISGITEIPLFPSGQVVAHVFTSGSTGEPVPHAKQWGSLVASALAAGSALCVNTLPGAILVSTVPAQHMYGLESSLLLAWQNGLIWHNDRPFYPEDICAQIADLPRPRVLVTSPVHLRALLSDILSIPPVDLVICATAPLAGHLATQAEIEFCAPVMEIYGCTESGQVAVRRPTQSDAWQCMEGLALRTDPQGTTTVSGGHVGQEVLLNDFIEIIDSEHFMLHDRHTDLVNIAGKRASLASLNHLLNSIPGVQDGVFVMPKESHGRVERLMAFVVSEKLDRNALLKELRDRIDPAFLPRPLHLIASLPRDATGKLPRIEIDRIVQQCENVKEGTE